MPIEVIANRAIQEYDAYHDNSSENQVDKPVFLNRFQPIYWCGDDIAATFDDFTSRSNHFFNSIGQGI